ncbi:DUF222 domain-containing protein [Microbacterium neungamense]|nr:DUF222 domain-containing protein [Microbacterium neungamense]
MKQMQADALADLCRHALGCTKMPTLATTTVVVRISLSDLQSGAGTATIDGITQPVSAATARRMAADAQVRTRRRVRFLRGTARGTWWRITCAGGCGTAEARISATASCSASPAITASTTTAGRYASRGRA